MQKEPSDLLIEVDREGRREHLPIAPSIPLFCGTILIVIGLIVSFAWHFKSLRIAQLDASCIPVQPVEAFFLLSIGLASVFLALGKPKVSRAFCLLSLALTLLVLFSRYFGLGLESLVFSPDLSFYHFAPGEVPHASLVAATASTLMLLDVLSIMGSGRFNSRFAIFAAAVFTVSLGYLMADLSDMEELRHSVRFSSMAILSAVAFTVLGGGFILQAWQWRDKSETFFNLFFPLVLGLPILVGGALLHLGLELKANARISEIARTNLSHLKLQLALEMDDRTSALSRMAARISFMKDHENPAWRSDVNEYLKSYMDLIAIHWLDSNYRILGGQAVLFGDNIVLELSQPTSALQGALATTRRMEQALAVERQPLPDGRAAFHLLVPIAPARQHSGGYLVSTFDVQSFVQENVLTTTREFDMKIFRGGLEIFSDFEDLFEKRRTFEATILFPGQSWKVVISPKASLISKVASNFESLPLISAFLLYGLTAYIIILYQRSLQRAAELHIEISRRREAEAELSSMNESLEQKVKERTIGIYRSQRATFNMMEDEQAARKRAEKAEKELRDLNEDLERRVVLRTAELEASNKELESFSYSVSHDLRAPLRHMAGFAELLYEHFADELNEKARRYVERIRDSSREMGILIDELLRFSRSARQELRMEAFSLTELVNEVLAEFEEEISGRSAEIEVDDLGNVFADRSMIKQVIFNLISNALKYSSREDTICIKIGVSREGRNEKFFFVRDNGVGFDMKYADKLFGVFQRLHHREEFEGTGIGLATVHRIVTKHGGFVWAESELGKGATFYFSLQEEDRGELSDDFYSQGHIAG